MGSCSVLWLPVSVQRLRHRVMLLLSSRSEPLPSPESAQPAQSWAHWAGFPDTGTVDVHRSDRLVCGQLKNGPEDVRIT